MHPEDPSVLKISGARREFWALIFGKRDASPVNAHSMPSRTVDLPLPFGPTRIVMRGSGAKETFVFGIQPTKTLNGHAVEANIAAYDLRAARSKSRAEEPVESALRAMVSRGCPSPISRSSVRAWLFMARCTAPWSRKGRAFQKLRGACRLVFFGQPDKFAANRSSSSISAAAFAQTSLDALSPGFPGADDPNVSGTPHRHMRIALPYVHLICASDPSAGSVNHDQPSHQ